MLEPTSEEFHEDVCKQYNTSLKQVKKDVKVLKDWIRQQPHLPQCSSDTLLTTFLIASKNQMERAKEKIDNYYTVRQAIPEFYGDRDPDDERARLLKGEIKLYCLPKLTPEGYRVTMSGTITGDVDRYDMPAFCKRAMSYLDVRFNRESFYMGDYIVMDCNQFTKSHIFRFTPTLIKNLMYCIQDVTPIIIKGIFLFNAPTYVEIALNIFRPFLKKKLIERIHIHTEGPEVLEKYFPKKLLPKDYGGEEEPSIALSESWNQLLIEKRDWLMSEGAVTVDEKKRIGTSNTRKSLGLQEMQGSFKSLCVD